MPTALSIPEFDPKTKRPPFIPYDLGQLQNAAQTTARGTLNATEKYRANHNPAWDRALKVGAEGLLDDATGDATLMPQIQSEAVRAGLGDALGAFGDTPGTLTPGSAGSAKVSTNLFGTANALNQQMRDNRLRALQVGSQVFPDTQIGLSGQDAALIGGANILGLNSFNEANFRDDREDERLNWRVNAENIRSQIQTQNAQAAGDAQASSAQSGALIQGGAAVAGVAVLAIAL